MLEHQICGDTSRMGFKRHVMRCVGRRWGRSKGDTWWNEEVKEAVSKKKEAHKLMCRNNTEENNNRYKSMKNETKEAVSKAMREKAEEAPTE